MVRFRVEHDYFFTICLKLCSTEAKTKISIANKKACIGTTYSNTGYDQKIN